MAAAVALVISLKVRGGRGLWEVATARLSRPEEQSLAAPRHGGFRADDLHSGLCGLRRRRPMADVRHGSQTARPVREACDGEAAMQADRNGARGRRQLRCRGAGRTADARAIGRARRGRWME